MPSAATLPHLLSKSAGDRKASAHARTVESRVSALEARWEATVPTLATSLDLSNLRIELRNGMASLEVRLIKWVWGAAVGLLFAVLGMFFSGYNAINARFDSVNARFDSINARFDSANTRLDSVVTELREEIRETNVRMDARFEKMDEKLEKIEAKFDALLEVLRSQRSDAH